MPSHQGHNLARNAQDDDQTEAEQLLAIAIIHQAADDVRQGSKNNRRSAALFFGGAWFEFLADGLGVHEHNCARIKGIRANEET